MNDNNLKWNVHRSNVLVEPIPKRTETKTGLIIPGTAQQYEPEGTIVKVGPGFPEKGEPTQAKVGEYIRFMPMGFTPINLDGKIYLLMDEQSILVWK